MSDARETEPVGPGERDDEPRPSLVGEVIDRKYRVLRQLGEGGMGAVFEAEHVGTGRRVALKVILTVDLAKNAGMVARFQREARAAGSIDTEHIVQVLDTGRDAASRLPYMVMELLRGEDVGALLERSRPLRPEIALAIVAQACVGLQKAHDAGVVHRDVKPANLFLSRREDGGRVVKVLDFGIAKIRQDGFHAADQAALTRTGSILGSPLYMSPEQAKGLTSIDARTDVWSLGAVLYELLAGRTPWHDLESVGQIIVAICSERPPPLAALAPWAPPAAIAIVERCLIVDPARRYASAAELRAAALALLPHGAALDEGALAPYTPPAGAPAVRSQATLIAPGGTPISSPEMFAPTAVMPTAGRDGSGELAGIAGRTDPGAGARRTTGASTGARAGRRRVTMVSALVVAASVTAAVSYHRLRGSVAEPPGSAISADELTPATAPPPPRAASVAPAASQADRGSTTEPALTTARLEVQPPDATVEVDGHEVVVADGAVTIVGRIGSIHEVRARAHGREAKADVALTERGASPPAIAVDSRPAFAPGRIRPPAASPPRTSPPAPAAAKPDIDKKFD